MGIFNWLFRKRKKIEKTEKVEKTEFELFTTSNNKLTPEEKEKKKTLWDNKNTLKKTLEDINIDREMNRLDPDEIRELEMFGTLRKDFWKKKSEQKRKKFGKRYDDSLPKLNTKD